MNSFIWVGTLIENVPESCPEIFLIELLTLNLTAMEDERNQLRCLIEFDVSVLFIIFIIFILFLQDNFPL